MQKLSKIMLAVMIFGLLGCSNSQSTNNQNNITHANGDDVKRYGKIILSFERSEFIYDNKTYYLSDTLGVFDKMIQEHRSQSSYLIEKDICLIGAFDNRDNRVGHLERYDSTFVVRKIC